MKTLILTTALVAAVGTSNVADAQSRYRPATSFSSSNRAGASSASRTPLQRGPVAGARSTSATRSSPARSATRSTLRPSGGRGIMAPIIPPRDQRTMSQAASRLFRVRPGAGVTPPRGATRESVLALFRAAWDKMMTGGRDVKMVEVEHERGTSRTFYIAMHRTTGVREEAQLRYPPRSETFRHVAIRYWSTPRGIERITSVGPSGPPPRDAVPVDRRLY
jgi:hypothetical protein